MHLVGPVAEVAGRLDALQDVGVAAKVTVFEPCLDNHVGAVLHGLDGPRPTHSGRQLATRVDLDDAPALRAQRLDVLPLVLFASTPKHLGMGIDRLRDRQLTARDGEVQADAVATGEEGRQVGRGENERFVFDAHALTWARALLGCYRIPAAKVRYRMVMRLAQPAETPRPPPASGIGADGLRLEAEPASAQSSY